MSIYDLSYSSSRGRLVDPILRSTHPTPSHLYSFFQSSRKLHQLATTALYDMNRLRLDPESCHVYFLAGYCDITERLVEPYHIINESSGVVTYGHKEEVVFREDTDKCTARMCKTIKGVSDRITVTGAKPCFSTIPPASVKDWNRARLKQKKTVALSYDHLYDTMNVGIKRVLQKVNSYIVTLNAENNMTTPYVASKVMVNQPGKDRNGERKLPRVHYNMFSDGVHPSEELALDWGEKLIKSMKSNREPPTAPMSMATEQESDPELDTSGEDYIGEAVAELQEELQRKIREMKRF